MDMQITLVDVVIGIVITWGWGLSIPLALRYFILKRPIDNSMAALIAGGLWITNIFIFTALKSQSKTHAALFLVAWASYWILTRKNRTSVANDEESIALADNGNKAVFVSEEINGHESPKLAAKPIDLGFKGKRTNIYLVASFIFYKVNCFDIKGKKQLATQEK